MQRPELWAWFFVLAAVLLLILYIQKNRKTGRIIFTAFLLRLSLAILNRYYGMNLSGPSDAGAFEQTAYNWSQLQGSAFWEMFEPTSAYTFSWFGALIYKVFGRSPFLLEVCVITGGTLCVYLTIKIAQLLVNNSVAYKAGWFAALFPSSIQLSAIYLREVPIILFSLLGIYCLLKWSKSESEIYFFLGVFGFACSTNFHGAYVIAVILTAVILFLPWIYSDTEQYYLSWTFSATIILIVGIFMISISEELDISKIGNISVLFHTEKLASASGVALDQAARGTALYLQSLQVNNPLDLVWQTPIRVFYFLFTPFPWQIRSAVHLIGFIDALFYYWMIYQIIKHRKVIFSNKQLLLILTFSVVMVIVFSFGTSNFGTAVRHRAKFAPFLIIISTIVFYYGKYVSGVKEYFTLRNY